MKIYIAGPITGILDYKVKFAAAEEYLIKAGHTVLNPSLLPDGLKDYMPICKAMIDQSEALYMLINYENSIGAMEELEYAREHCKKIFFQINEVLSRGGAIYREMFSRFTNNQEEDLRKKVEAKEKYYCQEEEK